MAIENTNILTSKLGVSLSSSYIRLEITLKLNGKAEIAYLVYGSKSDYISGNGPINNALDFDFGNVITAILSPSDITIDNFHTLAIAELVSRGQDNAKLVKKDLVV